jgi:hypothetical protein
MSLTQRKIFKKKAKIDLVTNKDVYINSKVSVYNNIHV